MFPRESVCVIYGAKVNEKDLAKLKDLNTKILGRLC